MIRTAISAARTLPSSRKRAIATRMAPSIRLRWTVEIVALTDGAFALLEILRAGETFAAAVAGAAAAEPAFGPDDALSLLMGQGLAIGFGDA